MIVHRLAKDKKLYKQILLVTTSNTGREPFLAQ